MNPTDSSITGNFVDQSDPGIQVFGAHVRLADVKAFCKEVLPHTHCRACEVGDYEIWLYSPTPDRVSVATSVRVIPNSDTGGERFELNMDLFMPLFYMVCERCGHVQNHTAAKVVNWLKDKEDHVHQP